MGEITITIKTDSNVIVDKNGKEIILPVNNDDVVLRKKGKSKNPTGHCVTDEALLSKILGAGLFHKMRGVNYINGVNKYFFNRDENIKSIIDDFYKTDESVESE